MIRGKAWAFGDNVNTDLIQPMHALFKPRMDQVRYVFEANRPGWVGKVNPGDLIVAGENFGTGSSRPAARVLKDLGIGGLVCESYNSLFFRNCVNFALPALVCPGILAAVAEGDAVAFDLETGAVENESSGTRLQGIPWAPELLKIERAGGLIEQLRAEDLLVESS